MGDPEPEVFLLRVTGTSVFPWRKLWPKLRSTYQNQPWKTVISLTSEQKSNDKGTYYVMVPGDPTPLDTDVAALVRDLALGMAGLDLGKVEGNSNREGQIAPREMPVALKADIPKDQLLGLFPDTRQPARVTMPASPGVTREQAQEIVDLCAALRVPPATVTAAIISTFKKNRILELSVTETAAVKKWLLDEFGQVAEAPSVDDLPF